eukprot:2463889-Prymnesium_polylepis.1
MREKPSVSGALPLGTSRLRAVAAPLGARDGGPWRVTECCGASQLRARPCEAEAPTAPRRPRRPPPLRARSWTLTLLCVSVGVADLKRVWGDRTCGGARERLRRVKSSKTSPGCAGNLKPPLADAAGAGARRARAPKVNYQASVYLALVSGNAQRSVRAAGGSRGKERKTHPTSGHPWEPNGYLAHMHTTPRLSPRTNSAHDPRGLTERAASPPPPPSGDQPFRGRWRASPRSH